MRSSPLLIPPDLFWSNWKSTELRGSGPRLNRTRKYTLASSFIAHSIAGVVPPSGIVAANCKHRALAHVVSNCPSIAAVPLPPMSAMAKERDSALIGANPTLLPVASNVAPSHAPDTSMSENVARPVASVRALSSVSPIRERHLNPGQYGSGRVLRADDDDQGPQVGDLVRRLLHERQGADREARRRERQGRGCDAAERRSRRDQRVGAGAPQRPAPHARDPGDAAPATLRARAGDGAPTARHGEGHGHAVDKGARGVVEDRKSVV